MGRVRGRVLAAVGTAAIFGGFLGFLIYSAAWSPGVRAASPLAESLESEVLTDIQRQLEGTFDQAKVAVGGCGLAAGMALNGSTETWGAIESMRPVLWGTLRGNAAFESAGFQAESNLSVSFVTPAEGGAYRQYRRTSTGSTVLSAYTVTDDWGAAVPDPEADVTAPPLRDRAWYVRAVAQRGAVVFSGFVSVLGVPAVTASTTVSGPSGVLLGAVNVGLSMRRLTQGLNRTGGYVVFVVSGPNATLVASSSTSGGGGQLAAAVDNPDPLISGSAGQLGSALTDGFDHRRVITVRGRRYVAGVRRLSGRFNVTAVVLMPWDRFFAQLERNRRVIIGTFSSAVVLWVLFAGAIAACFVRLWRREQGHLAAARHDATMHRKKQRLLATLSHELRTPMAVVMGVLEEMQDEAAGGAFDESIRLLRKTSADMLHLLDGILMLAKNEAGKSNVESQLFGLRVELEQALAGIGSLVAQRGVRTWLRYGEGLSDDVIGDRRKLRQVLDNLLSNAAKFTKSGEIGIVTRRGADGADGSSRVEIAVRDTGCGIPSGMEEEVFREFVHADDVRDIHGGTGLGLSIVRSLCRLMGGDVEISETGPGGTTFRFWVRLVLAGSFRERDIVVGAMDRPVPLEGLRVLVAEDTRVMSKLIERFLTKEGAEPTMTADGLELLETYEARPGEYSVILMDLQMPRMNGYEATRRIRQKEAAGELPGRVPIIALTAHAMESDERECRRVGMSSYIRKPLDRGTIVSTLLRCTRTPKS
jgi:signal transduction histidine kinase/ActR/RegA family two-component response regulator